MMLTCTQIITVSQTDSIFDRKPINCDATSRMKQHWRATRASMSILVVRPSAKGRNIGILLDEDLPASEGFAKDADSLLSNCSLHNPWPFADISNQFEP